MRPLSSTATVPAANHHAAASARREREGFWVISAHDPSLSRVGSPQCRRASAVNSPAAATAASAPVRRTPSSPPSGGNSTL